MTAPVPPAKRALTENEEVTLRRVAFGQSEVRAMRREDLAALRALNLIVDHRDGPALTAQGRKVFEALPQPAAQAGREPLENMLNELTRVTGGDRR